MSDETERDQVRQEMADAWFARTGDQMVCISDSYLDAVLAERNRPKLILPSR